MPYFTQFPTIQYANTEVRDISRRTVIAPSVLRQPTAFHPQILEDGQRDDFIAKLYYDQEDDDWMIRLANQIVDPYYGWYMTTNQFNQFIIKKYGSIEDAQQRVAYWLCNWAEDDTQLPVNYYENNLTEPLKKYWIPNYGQGVQIISYRRREEDWTLSTNMHQTMTCTANSVAVRGELATVYSGSGERAGAAEVMSVVGANVALKDVLGTWQAGFTISTASGNNVIASVGDPVLAVDIDERVYFSPVYMYDMEYDKNEENKAILLIQDSYKNVMYSEVTKKLNE